MEVVFEKVLERDIDLLLINKFANDTNFVDFFQGKFGLSGYHVEKVEHSLTDNNGESDITIFLSNSKEVVGLLIEDKIDACAMPNQKYRYELRGKKGLEQKKYDKFFVCIVAPFDYLQTNAEAQKYRYQISYEELLNILNNDLFAKGLIEKAIEEKKRGYIVIEDENVTEFWSFYYKYIKEKYPRLKVKEISGPRGRNASWPQIQTPMKNVTIIHKSDRGFLDLTFRGVANYYRDFMSCVKKFLEDDMTVCRTGKSLSVRLNVPKINFKNNFNECVSDLEIVFSSANRLLELLEKFDMGKIYSMNNNL